jgi:hypothetical protein
MHYNQYINCQHDKAFVWPTNILWYTGYCYRVVSYKASHALWPFSDLLCSPAQRDNPRGLCELKKKHDTQALLKIYQIIKDTQQERLMFSWNLHWATWLIKYCTYKIMNIHELKLDYAAINSFGNWLFKICTMDSWTHICCALQQCSYTV